MNDGFYKGGGGGGHDHDDEHVTVVKKLDIRKLWDIVFEHSPAMIKNLKALTHGRVLTGLKQDIDPN